MKRCAWCNENNPVYMQYHDAEWGRPRFDDTYLLEMLILESFQAGLSWECVLNKRENFRRAFDGFERAKIMAYDAEKQEKLACDPGIIRNRRKIKAAVDNAVIFDAVVHEYGSFIAYLKQFWDGETIFERDLTHNELSDRISADLIKRGMKFVGTTIVYSYLQAVGIVNSHEKTCFLYQTK
ncbi:DNA-3-methyladenine glycosylase I [Ructibacterium gallinarum]|uniref:DNA-3-methyladenine glycosylase I n=1 Tax=Ructibacterium gallinarum TaxID=2779355 RepID=A0A9D5M156_9FIRM|nr:DNA-3-methyladenine glycosylase I [Ructibacterium gallinarum]MBE5039533.1 DNA-3-methyladenine glycosylase I [Ructibacterium gallinarum]